MNAASLMLGLMLLGQSSPAAQTGQPAVGPRYRNTPSATDAGPARSEQGMPSLPGRKGPRGGAQGLPMGGFGKAGQPGGSEIPAANPVELAPASGGSGELDSINLPTGGPGNAVGSYPFPAPESANPLRVADGEIPAASAIDGEAPPHQTPVYNPNEVITPAQQQPYTQPAASTELQVEPQQFEPRQFEPAGALEPQDPPASSFVPAVIDEHVTPASVPAGSQLVSVQPPDKEPASDRILREALTQPELNSLAGKPVTLDELLASHESVGERHATVIRTYWQLCSAIARYHWALEEQTTLEQVTAGRQVPFSATAELAALRAKTLQTKALAVEAQHALAAFRARPAGTELPLPVDRPVVAAYRTYYESLFANRSGDPAVRNAQRLNETLPLHLEAAKALAESVAAAEDLARPASNANTQGQLDLAALIQSMRHLQRQREAFLSEVQTYNESIAEYAMLAVAPGSSASSLLPMLIKVKPRTPENSTAGSMTPTPSLPDGQPVSAIGTFDAGTTLSPSGVIPATAEIPIGSSPAFGPVAQKPLRSVLVRSNKR